jgi:hypothetical protein
LVANLVVLLVDWMAGLWVAWSVGEKVEHLAENLVAQWAVCWVAQLAAH